MRSPGFILVLLALLLLSCEKDANNTVYDLDEIFVPTDVFVHTKPDCTIDKVFNFINSMDHPVEFIRNSMYYSALPSDSLQYVKNYLSAKPYINDGNAGYMTGYLHYQTNQIIVLPELTQIKNKAYQADWLHTMGILKLVEYAEQEESGYFILFHVPEGTEKMWVRKFKMYDFVEWAGLNTIVEINPWP
jgi:hypothetical protein